LEKVIIDKGNEEDAGQDDHLSFARHVIGQIGQENLLSTVAHVWVWRDAVGVWRPIPDRELKQIVQQALDAEGVAITRALVDAVVEVLKNETFASGHVWNTGKDIINVQNGELVWNGNDWELQPHNRE